MEKFTDFIKVPFGDFVLPLTIIVVGIILFVVIYNKENKRINKYRKDIQQQIVNEEMAKRLADKYKSDKANNH